jgi:di/tricarboxylate transporter
MGEFSLLGVIMLAAGIVYMATIGRRLLPSREHTESEEAADANPRHYMTEVVVEPDSPLVGQTLQQARLMEDNEIEVLDVYRKGVRLRRPLPEIRLASEDLLLIWGPVDHILALEAQRGLAVVAQRKLGEHPFGHREAALVEGIVAADSVLEGKTLKEINFRGRFGATALAVRRHGEPLTTKLGRLRLRFGDALLIHGPREAIEALEDSPDFLILEELHPPALRRRRWPVAVAALGSVVVLGAAGIPWLPIHAVAICAVLALILGRVMSLREAYSEIDMRVVFLIAGLIPLGQAMSESGAARLLAEGVVALSSPFGPVATLAAFYLMTTILTAAMTNTAAALLMAELAVEAAGQFPVPLSPQPFLIAVCFAGSASFVTPIGYQTNTMIYGPGGYRFLDFTRIGLPLQIVFLVLATFFIPIIWPLFPSSP